MTASAKPSPTFKQLWAALYRAGDVTELRMLTPAGVKTGYFDNAAMMQEEVAVLDGKANIYFCLNSVNREMLNLCKNRTHSSSSAAKDSDIPQLRWLLIDIDVDATADHPPGTSASDFEHDTAIKTATACKAFIEQQWGVNTIFADSGNGAHLLLPVDVENTRENVKLLASVLKGLAYQFNGGGVHVDANTHNPARITKCYGVLSIKGENTRERPHRRSAVRVIPDDLTPAPVSVLQSMANLLPAAEPPQTGAKRTKRNDLQVSIGFHLPDFFAKHNISIHAEAPYEGGKRFQLVSCPFDPNDKPKDAAVLELANGAFVFKCLHDSCSDKKWEDFREYYEPGSTAERERKARSWEQYESSTRGQIVRTGTTALPQPADTNFDLTLSRLPHTDLGNAERLVARFGDNIRYCYEWKCWMSWSGTQWVQDKTGDIHRKAQSAARLIFREVSALTKHLADTAPAAPRSLLDPLPLTELDPVEPHKQSRTPEELLKWQKRSEAQSSMSAAAVLAQNQLGIPVLVDSLDTDNMLLNVRNGTINLRTGKLQDHRRNDLITKRVEIDFDPTAECPTWLRFLTEVSADADTVAFLKRAVGYTLTGDTSEDALFFCWGTGRNGKSTFMRVLEGLLGDYAVRLRAEALMTDKNPSANAATPALARLQGARLVAVSEIEEGRRLNEALIKDLTGNDKISARALYQDEFQFKPQFKAWLCGNHKPVIRGDDEGIWRRPKFVPFTVTIPEASKDTMLAAKLAAEMSGVLRWAVEGCLEWQRDGLNPSAAVLSATQGYREEMDVVGQFIGERCIVGAKFDVSATALFTGYTIWCETNGTRPMTMRAFGLRLTNKNYGTETNRRGVTRLGLGLKADLRYADAEVCEPCEPCEVKNSKTPPEKSHVYRNFSENGSQGSQGSHNHAEAEAVEQFTEEGEVVRI